MKYTIGQLKAAEEALIRLSKQEMPVLIAIKLSRFLKEVSFRLKNFEESRNSLIVKYGKENIEKGITEVIPENMDVFMKELQPLLSEEVDIPFEKFAVEELNGVRLTPTEVAQMDVFILS